MTVEPINMPRPLFDALKQASDKTGVDFDYLLKTAQRESSLNPQAKAPTSSATGLYQFIESTWLEMIDKHGAKYGLSQLSEAITKSPDGSYQVDSAAQRRSILSLRNDPGLSALMAAQLTKDNGAILTQKLGRLPKQGELYMAHFLGAQGAATLVQRHQSHPQMAAAQLFPQAASANPALFYRKGAPVSVAALYDRLGRDFSQQFTRPNLAFAAQQIGDVNLPQHLPQAPRYLSFDFDQLYSSEGARRAPAATPANHLAFFHHFESPHQTKSTVAKPEQTSQSGGPGLWNLYAPTKK